MIIEVYTNVLYFGLADDANDINEPYFSTTSEILKWVHTTALEIQGPMPQYATPKMYYVTENQHVLFLLKFT